jgi:adenylosuccinate lyase
MAARAVTEVEPERRDIYDSFAPIDFRYYDRSLTPYLSENAYIEYQLRTEVALARVLASRGVCTPEAVAEIESACGDIKAAEVYAEEDRVRHNVRALVNCIQRRVSDATKPYVHLTATSFDITDTANAARFQDATKKVAIPAFMGLENELIKVTARDARRVQVGRTHGQHGVPITFGFAVAEYVSRFGQSILKLDGLSSDLVGKFSGAVGAYNASSLFFNDPEAFEREVLGELGLVASDYSTQIVQPEPMTRLMSEYVIAAGIMANLADDMRHLQRTEIGEVGEEFEAEQVGSSTMPQKRNPLNFENAKSVWKIVMPRMMTVYMDQISEHQRDLTNSASSRTDTEIVAYAVSMAKRLARTMAKLRVDPGNLEKNLRLQGDLIAAEPLYIMLAAYGHSDAHEAVRRLTLVSQAERRPLGALALQDESLAAYVAMMTPQQREILDDPGKYLGIAAQKAESVATTWQQQFKPQ